MANKVPNNKKVILFYGKTEEGRKWHWMPINMVFLASVLIKEGYNVIIIDERVNPDYEDYFVSLLPEALLLGISSSSGYQIKGSLKAAEIARKHRPDLLIVWGGAHPSSLPDQTIRDPHVDIVVRGQGITPLVALVKAVECNSGFNGINGLTFCRGGQIVANPSSEFLDINTLPPLPLDLFSIEKYINPQTRALNYTASIGCTGYCTFCFWESAKTHKWQAFETERVLDDLEWLLNKYGIKVIHFLDANFPASEKWIIELCNGILKRKLKFKWNFEGRVDEFNKLSDETFKLCEKAGINAVMLGVESVSSKILNLMNKKITPQELLSLIDRSKSFSFSLILNLMFGIPGETMEDLKITKDFFSESLKINPRLEYQRGIFAPYPSTGLYRLALKYGYRPPQSLVEWQEFRAQSVVFDGCPPWISKHFFDEYKTKLYDWFPKPVEYIKHLTV